MKKCSNCLRENHEDAKFCDECGEKISFKKSNSIEVADIIKLQRNMKKDIDLEKSEEDLTPEQLVYRKMYDVLGNAVEESIGKDKKKEIEMLGDSVEFAHKVRENITKLVEIGKEIEKNFLIQKSYLTVFFESEPENHFKVVVNKVADEILTDKSLSNDDRVERAEKILQLVEAYRAKILKEILTKQEIVQALLPTFEKKIYDINFEKYKLEFADDLSDIQIASLAWLELTKALIPYRNKAIEAVRENLEMEEIVPRSVIENNGDITKNISGMEMFTKGERVLKLTSEANDAEKKVSKERTELSQWLFGKEEEYMDFLKDNPATENSSEIKSTKKSNKMKWVIVTILSIIALSGGIWTAIGVFILGIIIINILYKE